MKPLTPFVSSDPRFTPEPTPQPAADEPQSFPATVTVHAPNGPVHACDSHASSIVGLMAFLGTHAAMTEAPEGAQCVNCIREAALS